LFFIEIQCGTIDAIGGEQAGNGTHPEDRPALLISQVCQRLFVHPEVLFDGNKRQAQPGKR
jgi:hypothetical protein